MTIGKAINKLRSDANLSQEQFATLFGVSQQSVQKWENGDSVPELSKIIKISKHFGVSLDALILGNDNRIVEGMKATIRKYSRLGILFIQFDDGISAIHRRMFRNRNI